MESFDEKLARVLGEHIEVVEYDPAWPALFEAQAARLAAFFPAGSIRFLEHIGSTAVPGLAAKPIVDILVGVDDLDLVVSQIAPAMERAGYDYFFRPAIGDEGPRYPWFIGRDTSGARISHIHVTRADDTSQWDHVVFRDYLRSHDDAATGYATLKRGLAARFADDREAYTRAKSAFITGALARARLNSALIMVSACLAGQAVRYDGLAASVQHPLLTHWLEDGTAVAFCPEVAAGLPVPRDPAEIVGGAGADVLDGTARILSADGADMSHAYRQGAEVSLHTAMDLGVRIAILKDHSPSCGVHEIHDGSFTNGTIPGRGVTAELLERAGISVFSEDEIDRAARYLATLSALPRGDEVTPR